MGDSLGQTLRDHLPRFCDWLSANGYTERTVEAYSSNVVRFSRWIHRREDLNILSDIDSQVLNDFIIDLSTEPGRGKNPYDAKKTYRSLNTVNSYLTSLVSFFSYLAKSGLLLMNPALNVDRPKKHRPIPRDILSFEELLRVFAAFDETNPRGLRNRTILEMFYATGIRRAELESLDLGSVLLNSQVLRVLGKGGKERLVPLGGEAWRCLLHYLRVGRPAMRDRGSQALFLSTRGGRVKLAMILRDFKIVAKKLGITKRITLHGLRHACATHLLAAGADIRHIQAFLGHSQLSTTQIYTRVEVSDLKEMLDRCHPRDQF